MKGGKKGSLEERGKEKKVAHLFGAIKIKLSRGDKDLHTPGQVSVPGFSQKKNLLDFSFDKKTLSRIGFSSK